ncbi:MAG: hypothetical protein HYT87_19395 [Nitrospirae bacterium]|nr:hypothetical protein [Nitrospirota bacterium]
MAGSILPDAPYVIPLLAGGVTGALDVWAHWWNHPVTRILHSYPIVGATLILSLLLKRRRTAFLLGGILLHAFFDMWTHVSDAYPVFYPFSEFRFPTPFSYWEKAHHAPALRIVNGLLVAAAALYLWRERRSRRAESGPACQSPSQSSGNGVS